MRYILLVIGALVTIVIVIALVGWSLPVRHRASVARTYMAPASSLFQLITDVAAFPTWRSDVKAVEALPDENGHRRWRETTKNGPPITFVVDQMVPDRLLVGRIADTNLAFGGSWTYELTPAGNGTTTLRITEDGEVYNPIFRFVSRCVMGHDATMKQYLAAVAKRFPEVPEQTLTR